MVLAESEPGSGTSNLRKPMMFDPRERGLLRMARPRSVRDLPERTRELAESLVPGVDLRRRIFEFDIATVQLLELVKVLMCEPRVLILDEPTAVMGEHEQGRLYEQVARLRSQGVLVVMITHKIRDVRACADRVLVMRKGQLVSERRASSNERELLDDMMVISSDGVSAPRTARASSDNEVYRADRIAGCGWRDFSLSIKGGEFVGIAGISGSGQVDLGAMLAGFAPVDSGEIRIGGRVANKRRASGVFNGAGYIPDAPRDNAIAGALSMADNLLVRNLGMLPTVLDLRKTQAYVPESIQARIKALKVHPPALELAAGGLSGGNLQKLVVARELEHEAQVVVAVYPTMGLDPATQQAVLTGLTEAASAGRGVLLVHEDLEALMELCDRVIVVSERRVVGEFTRAQVDAHEVLRLMTGGRDAA